MIFEVIRKAVSVADGDENKATEIIVQWLQTAPPDDRLQAIAEGILHALSSMLKAEVESWKAQRRREIE